MTPDSVPATGVASTAAEADFPAARPVVRVAAIVLAAGEGSRMKSPNKAKALHGFAGRSLLGHALAALDGVESETARLTTTVVVVGHRRDDVRAHLDAVAPEVLTAVQEQQLGTGDAVRSGLAVLDDGIDTVLVLPADAPLLRAETLRGLVGAQQASGSAAVMLTARLADPHGYGRVIRDGSGDVLRVVEQVDATEAERAIDEVAGGVYAFDATALRTAIGQLGTDNAQGELYLPDVIAIFAAEGRGLRALVAPAEEIAGVNTRSQLAQAHRIYNDRLLQAHMAAGVTVIDPASTWIDADVQLGVDVTLRPSVELLGRTSIAEAATIGPDVTLTDTTVGAGSRISRTVGVDAEVGADCEVGPFAYLRPGAVLADEVKIGTYVEVKASDIGRGSKVPHLSYVGDATIGEHSNIGAASVFVNYDGVTKRRSVVGSHARTGADNMFVAPVTVGDGAYTAAGSVITEDVPPGALAVGRSRQRNVDGWVARQRAGTESAAAAQHAQASSVPTPASTDHPTSTEETHA